MELYIILLDNNEYTGFIEIIKFLALGFQNSLNEVSVVQLKVSCPGAPGSKTDTVAEGQPYKLRAEVLKYDG